MSIQKHVKQVVDEWICKNLYVFSGDWLIKEVKRRLNHTGRKPFDSTILRKLRALREEGYKIRCVDRHKSFYVIDK